MPLIVAGHTDSQRPHWTQASNDTSDGALNSVATAHAELLRVLDVLDRPELAVLAPGAQERCSAGRRPGGASW